MRRSIGWLLIAALLLSGCALAPRKTEPETLTGTLRVMVLGPAGLEQGLVDAFSKAHPDLRVEKVLLPDGSFQEILLKLQSGETKVDAIVAPGNAYLFKSGLVLPLDEQIRQARVNLKPYGSAIELARHQGQVYGLPVMVSPMVVVYNQDLFAEAGLEEPQPDWSWDAFERAAGRLAQVQADREKGWAVAIPPWALMDLLITAGDGPTDPDLTDLQTVLSRYRTLQEQDRGIPDQSLGIDDLDYFLAFARGEVGMLLGYWMNSFVHTRPEFAWSVAPLPADLTPDGQTPGIVTLAMVSAGAENPENAFAFVRFAAGKQGAEVVVRQPGAPIPGYVDEAVQRQWLQAAGLGEEASFALRAAYIPQADYPPELIGLLLQEASAVLEGQKTPDEAVRDYKQAREPLLSKK